MQELARTFTVTAQHVYRQVYRSSIAFSKLHSAIRLDLDEILQPTPQRGWR